MSYCISYVGAGGKTSSIYRDAKQFLKQGKTVLITTTTHMYIPYEQEAPFVDGAGKKESVVLSQVRAVLQEKKICVCGSSIPVSLEKEEKEMRQKFGMLPESLLEQLCQMADIVLIEADGAAHMAAKAPDKQEPAVYPQSDKAVIVMGLHAVGHRVDEVCHRIVCVKKVLDCGDSHILTKEDLKCLMQEYEKKIHRAFPQMQTEERYV